jgi:hypothetical protein
MRLMVDPDSLSVSDYVAVQTALIKDGTFTIIDRAKGMSALMKEQERLHRNQADRYMDKEKWAHWGKMYGVGAIVIGHSQCHRDKYFWNNKQLVNKCKQYLSIVDANTGEVIVAADGDSESEATVDTGSFNQTVSWEETVEKLIVAYPKEYKPQQYSEKLQQYRDTSEEEAKRQREISSELKNK